MAHRNPLLSGVLFYQGPVDEELSSWVRCHGRRSVYEAAYNALAG